MSLRRRPTAVLAAALLAAALPAAPAFASASAASGGASPDAPAATDGETTGTGGTVAVGTPLASASANGITITSRSAALLKQRANVTGVAPASLGQVRIEQLGADGAWAAVATAAVAADGSFKAAWRPGVLGAQQLRAVAATSASRSADGAPQLGVTVYRPGVASWYGPGFYGGKTACGVKLTKTTLGLAHKTLPCGTQVQVLYRNKTLTVPVIDRGPFIAGRSWDLTKATHAALGGLDGLVTIGALPLADAPLVKTPYQAPPTKR